LDQSLARHSAKTPSASLTAKEVFEKIPKTAGGCRPPPARDKHGTIRMIQNAACEIAHNVMAKQAACLRRAGHDQIVVAITRFFENLVDHNAMPKPHFGGDTEAFELSFLPAEICSEF
jgi:hypothetical protein